MKKSIAILKGLSVEKGILSVLLTILFLAAAQVDLSAQQNTVGNGSTPPNAPASRAILAPPTGNFVSVPVAIDRLIAAMTTQKEIMEQNNPGAPAYISAARRVKFYTAVLESLYGGKGVAESIQSGVPAITMSDVPGTAATPEEALIERNAAVNLLRA